MRAKGFTLIELIVVVAIMAMIMAVALPNLAPLIAFSGHDGAARRLANYGGSVAQFVVLRRAPATVKIDLEEQTYWTEILPAPDPSEVETDLDSEDALIRIDDRETFEQMQSGMGPIGSGGDSVKREQYERSLRYELDLRSRRMLIALAEQVDTDTEGLLDSVGPLFADEFSLDNTVGQSAPEEVHSPELARTRLPEGVMIDSVTVGEAVYTHGVVEIKFTALGLDTRVHFDVLNEEGDVLRVLWDPITGGGIESP